MKADAPELELLQDALHAIENVLARAGKGLPEVPYLSPTTLGQLPEDAQVAARLAEEASYRARPTESAIHFCLTSAIALLDVSQTLLTQPQNPSPQEQQRQWSTLISHTKVAGRSAYRAALILADQKAASH